MKNRTKGFTLIEMLVVAVIAPIIIGAAIGVFVSAIRNQRYILAAQQLLNQTSYVMEYMTKGLRMAKKDLGQSCLSVTGCNYERLTGPEGLRFIKQAGYCKTFRLGGVSNDVLVDTDTDPERKGLLSLTSEEDMEVTAFNVRIDGQCQTDQIQPRLTFYLGIKGRGSDPQPKMGLQVTVSQRDLDVSE